MQMVLDRLLLLISAIVLASLTLSTPTAVACGADSDCLLSVDDRERSYRIRLPEQHSGQARLGAVVFMHGYRGSAAGTMRNRSLRKVLNKQGLALVAAKSYGPDWAIPGVPANMGAFDPQVELHYFDALIADVTERFSIDPQRLLASGFSAGAMMVWTLACERGELFAGFAPISGTFWAPLPERCASAPVHLFHVHGSSDKIVPPAGRSIGDSRQGDIYQALSMFYQDGDFGDQVTRYDEGELVCERRATAAESARVAELCLHPGGHSLKVSYIMRAWRELSALGAL